MMITESPGRIKAAQRWCSVSQPTESSHRTDSSLRWRGSLLSSSTLFSTILFYLRTNTVSREYLLIKRMMGIEPTYPAWEAGVLPLNYTRIRLSTHSIIVQNMLLCKKFFPHRSVPSLCPSNRMPIGPFCFSLRCLSIYAKNSLICPQTISISLVLDSTLAQAICGVMTSRLLS